MPPTNITSTSAGSRSSSRWSPSPSPAPFIADHARLTSDAQCRHPPLEPPSWSYCYMMGTDEQGLSVWAEFVWSARISLTVGLVATAISTLLGASVGIAAGYYGGWLGEFWMRITEAFLVIPWLPLAMVLAAVWGHDYAVIVWIIGVTSCPGRRASCAGGPVIHPAAGSCHRRRPSALDNLAGVVTTATIGGAVAGPSHAR